MELAQKGFHGVTMNELAARAGVTKKTLYNVFGSKDQLLFAAVSEVIENYRDEGAHDQPGIAAIVASRRAAVEKVIESPDYANAMTSALLQASSDDTLVQILMRDSVRYLERQLCHERSQGGLAAHVEPHELAQQLTSLAWGQILMNYKEVVNIRDFAEQALRGTLQMLLGATQGQRHQWIKAQLDL